MYPKLKRSEIIQNGVDVKSARRAMLEHACCVRKRASTMPTNEATNSNAVSGDLLRP